MDDEIILARGGTQEDIDSYAECHGADLTKEDVAEDTRIRAFEGLPERMSPSEIPLFMSSFDENY